MNALVSIIIPCYNSEKYINKAIESVLHQTYKNWEMLIVDDCSIDKSRELIFYYINKYENIKYFKTVSNSGSAALARNLAIQNAKGKYIAFLDSDDMWLPTKLEEQLAIFSINTDAAIVYSDYEKISSDGSRNNRIILAPIKVNYKQLLKSNSIACSTAIYNTDLVGKRLFKQTGHEDYVLWLEILKMGYNAYNARNVLMLYRVSENSLSSNKLKVLKWQWNIYRNIERLNIFLCIKYFFMYATFAYLKYKK